jgi:hypothetical protein
MKLFVMMETSKPTQLTIGGFVYEIGEHFKSVSDNRSIIDIGTEIIAGCPTRRTFTEYCEYAKDFEVFRKLMLLNDVPFVDFFGFDSDHTDFDVVYKFEIHDRPFMINELNQLVEESNEFVLHKTHPKVTDFLFVKGFYKPLFDCELPIEQDDCVCFVIIPRSQIDYPSRRVLQKASIILGNTGFQRLSKKMHLHPSEE